MPGPVRTERRHRDVATHEKFGEFPGTAALLGLIGARGFTRALEKAGRDLTVDSFVKAMESLDYYDRSPTTA